MYKYVDVFIQKIRRIFFEDYGWHKIFDKITHDAL